MMKATASYTCANVCWWVLLSLLDSVWTDGVSQQYAVKMADLALSVCFGRQLGHQHQQSNLNVSVILSFASSSNKH